VRRSARQRSAAERPRHDDEEPGDSERARQLSRRGPVAAETAHVGPDEQGGKDVEHRRGDEARCSQPRPPSAVQAVDERDRCREAPDGVPDQEVFRADAGAHSERRHERGPQLVVPALVPEIAGGEQGLVDDARLEHTERARQREDPGPVQTGSHRDLADQDRRRSVQRCEHEQPGHSATAFPVDAGS
jgi:hypothetical protein